MDSSHLILVVCAIAVACVFEFINGFHDTANAVATVIYTRSLKPATAVVWSGLCNSLGVFLGGTAVAMGILKLLPAELLSGSQAPLALAMVFALLIAAILWNLGTWYLGLPASSSHTLIGSILGIGIGNAYLKGAPLGEGVNWTKAADIGAALVFSPIFGFALAALLLVGARRVLTSPIFHQPPIEGLTPPWRIRATLIATCTGVSLAHGSNDGQKGVGLVMLILITLLPTQFALRAPHDSAEMAALSDASQRIERILGQESVRIGMESAIARTSAPSTRLRSLDTAREDAKEVRLALESPAPVPMGIRTRLLKLEKDLGVLDRAGLAQLLGTSANDFKTARSRLKGAVEFTPGWVLVMVALALGLGTMVGWRRIVVTLGEKIGNAHMTYAQGAVAELVAMSTIGVSALAGLPVSTTHVLSSGIAGTMVAGKAGLNLGTVRSILLAWVLTLPVTVALSFGIFVALARWIAP